MKAVIEIIDVGSECLSFRGVGFYKSGEMLIIKGEDSHIRIPFSTIEPYVEPHKPPMTLNEIAASEEEEQDTVPAWFVLQLVKTLK